MTKVNRSNVLRQLAFVAELRIAVLGESPAQAVDWVADLMMTERPSVAHALVAGRRPATARR